MTKLVSGKKVVKDFLEQLELVKKFLEKAKTGMKSKRDQTWVHEYCIIRIYREFEKMVFWLLVVAVNRDNTTLSANILGRQGIDLKLKPHMNKSWCQFLITGRNYFDLGGLGGLEGSLPIIVGKTSYIHQKLVIKYKKEVRLLHRLRNFAAHDSPQSKHKVQDATGRKGIMSSGTWLKSMPPSPAAERKISNAGDWLRIGKCPVGTPRMKCLMKRLKEMADDLLESAPD